MARTYKRDSRGRFAGGGGGSSRGGGRKPLQRSTNRLTRDNAGRITSQGGDGATARGGRLRTASGKQRATVTAKGIGKAPAGTVGRSGRVKAPARVKATTQQGKRRTLPASARPASTTPKPRGLEPGAISGKIKPRDAARRANQLRARADRLDTTGNRLMGGGRNDRASTNVSLNSRARRNETAAGLRGLEMTRAASNLRGRASGIEAKARESSTKALREAAGIKPKKTRSAASRAARIAAGELTLKNAQVDRAEKRLSTLSQRRMNSSPSKRLKAEATKKRAQIYYNTKGRTWRERAAKPAAAAKPARRRSRAASITPDKTKRIADRVNRVTAASSSKTGVKRLNATEVSVRAKAFLTRKVGGMSGLQGKTFEQQQAAVKASLTKPTRYSTQKPNRNKPKRYDNLGQSSLRRKAAAANKVAAGGSIDAGSRMASQVNRSASISASRAPSAPRLATRSAGPSAPDNARTRLNRLRTMQARVRFNRSEPDSLSMSRAVTARNTALQARVPGTPGKIVFRGKNRAANRQNYRANDLTKRIRSDLQYSRPGAFSATAGGGRVGIRRTDTGNRQLAMFGQPAAKLMKTKRVKVSRPSGKSRR